ncbi:MAG: aspartate kinase, partial [Calditrichaeota bacterium]
MNISVVKFGGTSMGSAETINQCARIIANAQKNERIIAVVSAMSGVTDILIESVEQAANGNQACFLENKEKLRDRHLQTIQELKLIESTTEIEAAILAMIDEFTALCHAVHVLGEATPRALDAVVSLGERMSHHLLAAALRTLGFSSIAVDAGDFLVTDNHFQHANPDFKATKIRAKEVVLPLVKKNIIPIVTGFNGKTKEGATTTLGRGGSDYSAAIIGKVIDATRVIIWTDVTGVMSTDPRIDETARTIPVLAYSEVAELAYFGAKVLHPKCIRPSVEDGAELWVRNTFEPDAQGTQIVLDSQKKAGAIRA